MIAKTMLALLYSGLIGMERQTKNRPAGFRTHILVCLGAMNIMILSENMFVKYFTQYGVLGDPTRMVAQVISGIGFLGAGTIIHHGTSVKGLTTAATLWVVAAIGLTIGAGEYFLATLVTFTILLILFIFSQISRKVDEAGNILELLIDLVDKPKCIGRINYLIADSGAKILDLEFFKHDSEFFTNSLESKVVSLRVIIQLPPGKEHYILIRKIEELTGVLKVERV